MHDNSNDDRLLDLRPQHLRAEGQAELDDLRLRSGGDQGAIARELRYLELIGARRVAVPSDAHFAAVRQEILERVKVRRQNSWDRIKAAVIPESLRPIPAAISTAAIAVAVLMAVAYFPNAPVPVRPTVAADFGPHVTMSDVYAQHVTVEDEDQVSEQELSEYREILLMSSAILGSPSSLSRSRTLAQRGL